MTFQTSHSHALASARRQPSLDDRLIPLINIVFLLLIFFMIAGQISQQQNQQIQPPQSEHQNDAARPPWILEVDAHNALTLNGEALLLADLPHHFTGRAAAADGANQVTLKMDRSLRAEDLDAVLNVLRDSGQLTITLLTQLPEH